MKRIMFLLVTALMTCTFVMAQGNRRGGERSHDPKVRAERMTERMVKEYSMNDTQKQQLMELNLTMAEKMKDTPNMRHHKGKKGTKCECDNCTCNNKDKKEARNKKTDKADKKTTDSEVQRGNLIKKRLEMKEFRESYNAKLKDIMTNDQYAAYSKKQAEREQKMKERQDKKKS